MPYYRTPVWILKVCVAVIIQVTYTQCLHQLCFHTLTSGTSLSIRTSSSGCRPVMMLTLLSHKKQESATSTHMKWFSVDGVILGEAIYECML